MMQKLIKRLRTDDRGTALVEMAIAAPILATLFIIMVDLSKAYSEKLALEQAAQRAIEKTMQGTQNSTTYNALKSEAATAAGVAQSAVTVDFWLECNGTRSGVYDTTCPNGQTYARYLSVEITKIYMPTFKSKFIGPNADGSFNVKGKAGVRTQ